MQSAQIYLEVVEDRGKRRLELQRVYRHLQNRELFLRAYGKIYANDGALTPGADPTDTVDGMSLKRIDGIIESLSAGAYRWKPTRRVYLPKGNGKLRPLGLPSWQDKLLQEALRQILSAYYEPQFSNASHGFRPGRGCHTALRTIQHEWKGTKWFIEGDIKGCFDHINHEKLLAVIGRSIKDERLLKLLRGMLNAGYLENWKYQKTYSGTPQGGILSPLLANIFLNELDAYVEQELLPRYNKGGKRERKDNPEYRRVQHEIDKARRLRDSETVEALKKIRRTTPSCMERDPDFRRLHYIRYADDFLLGFIGPKAEAEQIKQAIGDFLLTIGLSMSEEKTLITSGTAERARFLGYEVSTAVLNNRLTKGRRATNGAIQLRVPDDVVHEWVRTYSQGGKPQCRGELVTTTDFNIVTAYGMELRGLANYYALAYNVSSTVGQKIKHVMSISLAKTLATKHKRTVRWAYRTYKRKQPNGYVAMIATVPREERKPLVATFGGIPIRRQEMGMMGDLKPGLMPPRRVELVQRLLANRCELCGSTQDVQVHHIRKVAELKRRWTNRKRLPPLWVREMLQRNRKTLVVCRHCHQDITHGRYDGPSLRRPTGEPDAQEMAHVRFGERELEKCSTE